LVFRLVAILIISLTAWGRNTPEALFLLAKVLALLLSYAHLPIVAYKHHLITQGADALYEPCR
jgi:hypothetical protein